MKIEDLPPLRQVIGEHGLSADKRFGQNYLLDINLTRKIARLCEPFSDHPVIEVGPGPGGLTRALLLEGASKVYSIERDRRFIEALQPLRAASEGRLVLIEDDALKTNETDFLSDSSKAILASNLPYNIGTALLIKWLEACPTWWVRMVLMFQKEVAHRICASPGDDAYGRLAILTAARASARMGLTVPARAFTPPPKVDSAVVVLEPLPEDKQFKHLIALGIVTASAFGQRRKTLRKSLKSAAGSANLVTEDWLEEAGIDPALRAETILPSGYFKLSQLWQSAVSDQN